MAQLPTAWQRAAEKHTRIDHIRVIHESDGKRNVVLQHNTSKGFEVRMMKFEAKEFAALNDEIAVGKRLQAELDKWLGVEKAKPPKEAPRPAEAKPPKEAGG